jgi:septation ring formation regulator EzrA
MSDITRIDETINFNIDDAKNAVDDNITIMNTRESELREFADHVRNATDNIDEAVQGYAKVLRRLDELQSAMEDVDGEAQSAMNDADSIDTSY